MLFDFLRKVPLYVKIYPDEMEVTDLRNGKTIRRPAVRKFSSPRMLVADFHAAEELGKSLLRELGIGRATSRIAIQHMVDLGGGIMETERRCLRDMSEHWGAIESIILLQTTQVEHAEVLRLLQLKYQELPRHVST